MQSLQDAVATAAEQSGFAGVVRVDRAGGLELSAAYGFADRAHEVPNTTETMFATASGAKTLTALAVMSLVERGTLDLGTTARSLLGERYLPALDGHYTVFPTGERSPTTTPATSCSRCWPSGRPASSSTIWSARSSASAGMVDTAFLRSDELPGRAALGYLSMDGLRTNVLHLPVRGTGDGGVYSTAADLSAFWDALLAGRIVSPGRLAEMVRPHSDWPEESRRYGLGFHLHATGDGVYLEGHDAGVSFASVHQPASSTTYTVISNWSEGAWPIIRVLSDRFTN